MTVFLLIAWLTVVWCALWGEPSVGNILAGLVLGTLIVLIFPPGKDRGDRPHPVAIVRFGLYFAWALIVSNVTVAYQVLRPKGRIVEGIVAVPLRTRSPLIATFVANAITLTPGTMTIEVSPSPPETSAGATDFDVAEVDRPIVLFVHCLSLDDADDIRAEGIRLEEYAVRAFGSTADRQAITLPPPTWPLVPGGPS